MACCSGTRASQFRTDSAEVTQIYFIMVMDASTVRLVKQDFPVFWEDVLKEFVLFLQSNKPAYFGFHFSCSSLVLPVGMFSFPSGTRS